MSKSNAVTLAPRGFPWRSALISAVVLAVLMGAGVMMFPMASVGGIFIVSALLSIAVFAGSLG